MAEGNGKGSILVERDVAEIGHEFPPRKDMQGQIDALAVWHCFLCTLTIVTMLSQLKAIRANRSDSMANFLCYFIFR